MTNGQPSSVSPAPVPAAPAPLPAARPEVSGKFFALGGEKLYLEGVTYGPFRPGPDGVPYRPDAVEDDFARIRAKVQHACEATGRTLSYSLMTGCLIGDTHADALERAHQLYERVPRETSFDGWLGDYSQRALIGSVEEVAARLREYESAGCERVMLQHLLHADLEPVRLIGRLGQELV